ncbi:ras-related protein Rab-22A-like [Ornithodoros turicata]
MGDLSVGTQDVKLCLLGNSGVGKSSIVQRFVYNTFNPAAESTIGASFMMKTLMLGDAVFKFNIWDTAGQERYRALAPMYYRGAAAAIIVYDITSMESFNAVKTWVKELQTHGDYNVALGIAGNKCDLEHRREVPRSVGSSYAEQIHAAFVETSAMKSTNIQELFTGIASRVNRQAGPSKPQLKIQLNENAKPKAKCC